MTRSFERLETRSDWADLAKTAAPGDRLRRLGPELTAAGRGQAVLFAGASGTGKTLAAQVLAGTLDKALLRVDLKAVASKYIGETEKNLDRAFAEAQKSGAVLLFDEADALFGKRSKVKDSHDRYANQEVSYLLERMERHKGLVILTTNQPGNLDAALARRMRAVIDFPPK